MYTKLSGKGGWGQVGDDDDDDDDEIKTLENGGRILRCLCILEKNRLVVWRCVFVWK